MRPGVKYTLVQQAQPYKARIVSGTLSYTVPPCNYTRTTNDYSTTICYWVENIQIGMDWTFYKDSDRQGTYRLFADGIVRRNRGFHAGKITHEAVYFDKTWMLIDFVKKKIDYIDASNTFTEGRHVLGHVYAITPVCAERLISQYGHKINFSNPLDFSSW